MSYSPTTDLLALLRSTNGGVRAERVPGLDYIVSALARAGLISLFVGQSPPTVNQATTVLLQPSLPSWTQEGLVFLWNATLGEFQQATPVLWSDLIAGPFIGLIPVAGNAAPLVDGVASVGVSLLYSRQDHVHPTDTTRAPLASPVFTGTPQGPTAALGDDTTNLATTAFVIANGGLPPPIGSVLPYAGAAAPNANWAIATGQAFSRTGATANLFAALGLTYGAGDGVTTFNGPDMRGRVVAGVDGGANRLTTATMSSQSLAGIGGGETSVLTLAQAPTGITSTNSGITLNNGIPSVFINSGPPSPGAAGILGASSSGTAMTSQQVFTSVTVATQGISTSNNTSGAAHPLVQPTIELNYIIRIS